MSTVTDKDKVEDLFPTEFRHDAVVNFINGLIGGSIRLTQPTTNDAVPIYAQTYSGIVRDVEKYVSGRLRGEELDAIESAIFRNLAILRSMNGIQDVVSQTQLEKDILELKARTNSTNALLVDVLKVLDMVVKKLDGN
jgi:hypothetical protein